MAEVARAGRFLLVGKVKNIKVIVATHKKYQMPKDKVYLPVHVGAEGKADLGYQRDNEGENISVKNPYYCELTGLYWAAKNLDADYIGLVHYRRYFSNAKHLKTEEEKFANVLSGKEIDKLLDEADIILPKKRNYYIENLYDHYKHTMYIEPLDVAGQIIAEKYPEYSAEFEKLHKRRSAHMFNMCIMKREILENYCNWLFDILFELEKRADVPQYSDFHKRFYGRVSELLLDVYINTRGLKYVEVPVVDMQNINWLKKGTAFLTAKFTGKRYEKSF